MSLKPHGSVITVKHSVDNCKMNNTEKTCSVNSMIMCDYCRCYEAIGASPCPMYFNETTIKCMLDRIEVAR